MENDNKKKGENHLAKILKALLAMTLIFQPMLTSTVRIIHAQEMEQIEVLDEYKNHNDEAIENEFDRLEEDEVLTENEETDENEKPPQNEIELKLEIENELDEEESEDKVDSDSENEEAELIKDELEDSLEDFLWQDRFLIVDEAGALIKIDEVMARSNATLIRGNAIPNTSFDFRIFNWVDPNNSWNLWQAGGLPMLQLRIGSQLFTVFCIEPAVPPRHDHDYMVSLTPNGVAQTRFSSNQLQTIELILLYGYGSEFIGGNQRTSDDAYVATQMLIWSVVANTPNASGNAMMNEWNRATGTSAMYRQLIEMRNSQNPNITTATRSTLYRQIKTDVNNHGVRPSFTGTTQGNAPTHGLTRSGNVFTTTLTDTHSVLSRYFTGTSATLNNFNLQRNGNQLTIQLSLDQVRNMNGSSFLFNGNTHAPFRKEFSGSREVSWATNPNSQDLVFGGASEPIPSFMNVSVPIRTVTINHVRQSNGAIIQTETPRFGNNENWLDGDVVRSMPRQSIVIGSTQLFPLDLNEVVLTINGGNLTINHYYEEARTVTVQHRLQGTTVNLIDPQMISAPPNLNTNGRWFDGMSVTSSPRTDITHNGRVTRPIDSQPITRTINGDVTITHYYEAALTVTAHHENERNGSLIQDSYLVFPETGHWFSGMRINHRSAPRVFTRIMPDGISRNWEHHSSENEDAIITGDTIVTHRYREPLQLTVQHLNIHTGEFIQTDIINDYFSGDQITNICPETNLTTSEGYVFVSETACRDVSLSETDVVVTFNYFVPTLTLNIERVEITTGQSILLTELRLSQLTTHSEHLGDIIYRIRLTNLATGTVTYTPERSWRDFRLIETVNLPTTGMEEGEDADIQIEVVFTQNPSPNQVITSSESLQTLGFKSSEQVLTNEDISNGRVSYTAPARTIASRLGTEMSIQILNETLSFDFTSFQRQKTGYGIPTLLNPIFISEINENPELEVNLIVQESLVDSFLYEQFHQEDDLITIPLEQTNQETMNLQTTYQFEFPQIFVQRGGGELFTTEQVESNHSQIQNELINGGRYFYIPTWHDLGNYPLNYASNQIGRNLIRFDVNQALEIYAYMFAWMGSPTILEDELLLIPVFVETAQPSGWTQAQIDWLRNHD